MAREQGAQVNAVFAAVSNPTRRQILALLKGRELPAGVLVAAFPALPQPAVSRHLKVLRESNLVLVEKRAQQRIYRINSDTMLKLEEWAKQMAQRLDALDEVVKKERVRES